MTASGETGAQNLYPIRAVDRVCDILDILAAAQSGALLTDVAERSSLPKSSAFRYLSALQARGYVAHDSASGLYRLGLSFRHRNVRELERLVQIAQPELNRLRDVSTETANLGTLDGVSILHLAVSESLHMMRLAARIDERGFVHSTALGKVLSADLGEREVRDILNQAGMPVFTPSTITDVEGYLAELGRVRGDGYGLDDEENQPAGRCVAVRIEGIELPAALSISAPADRLPVERVPEVAAMLRESARRISERMNATHPAS